MRFCARWFAVSLCLSIGSCSGDASAPLEMVAFDIGLLRDGVLQDSITVRPSAGGELLSITLVVENRGEAVFRYSGTMRSNFGSASHFSTVTELKGFELGPYEKKNIGVLELMMFPEDVGTRFTLLVEFLRQSRMPPATVVIVVEAAE
jgi:hypothetical protein